MFGFLDIYAPCQKWRITSFKMPFSKCEISLFNNSLKTMYVLMKNRAPGFNIFDKEIESKWQTI